MAGQGRRWALWVMVGLCLGPLHAQVLIPPPSPAALAWNRTLDLVWLAEHAIDLLLPLGLLFLGGQRIAAACERRARGRHYLALFFYACAYLACWFALRLPVEFWRHLAYPGSDADTTAQWSLGQLRVVLGLAIGAAMALWVPYALIRRSPRRWWLWLTLLAMPLCFIGLVLQPLWETAGYQPLGDNPLHHQLAALAARCGAPDIPVLVGGGDTRVVGLGPTNRIVLQDDLLKLETDAQIRFTIAHELKHYLMGDNWKALLIMVGFALLAGAVTAFAGRWLILHMPERIGFDRLDDIRSLPLLVFCTAACWVAITPPFLVFNRHIERQADQFGLELSHENEAAMQLFVSWIGATETAEPSTLARWTRQSHPSAGERIALARTYRPWENSGTPAPLSAPYCH